MTVTLNDYASPQVFTIALGGSPAKTLYSCVGIAMFYYAGQPNHDTLSIPIVDSAKKPITIPAGQTIKGSTAIASLNSIAGTTNTLWAVDDVKLESDVSTGTISLYISLAGNVSSTMMRIGYEVMFYI